MKICIYKSNYYDYQNKKLESFHCNEPTVTGSTSCMFHDDYYSHDYPIIVQKNLMKKVAHAISKSKSLLCIGYNIPKITISETFKKPVYFNQATFKEIDFSECIFENSASFQKITCEKNCFFNSCEFLSNAEFFQSTFKELADFRYTKFHKTNFSLCKFFKDAEFERIHFFDDVEFHVVEFHQDANFEKSYFKGKADYKHAIFYNTVSFEAMRFDGSVDFSFARFEDTAFFDYTEFNDECNFRKTKFNKDVLFDQSHFKKSTKFIEGFFEKVDFSGTYFEKSVDFSKSKLGHVNFREAVFDAKSIFNYCEFRDNVDFSKCEFNMEASFHSILFNSQNKVLYNGDLSNVTFLDTDITRVRFGDDVFWGKTDQFEIYDERSLKKNHNLLHLDGVLAIYRNLRENYEYQLRYDGAGEFFIKEMELKRKFRDITNNKFFKIEEKQWIEQNFSFGGVYYHLARYGESYHRPLGLASLLVVTSFLYFWFSTVIPILEETKDFDILQSSLEPSLIRTISTLSSFFNFQGQSVSDYLFRLCWVPIIGTLFISLRRKLERRFRH